ncbi:MAG: hypothetical protein NT000_01920 [Proteobacteria bacterium]|nr:hypothetical protein [Pseudomonadota bacterium]
MADFTGLHRQCLPLSACKKDIGLSKNCARVLQLTKIERRRADSSL